MKQFNRLLLLLFTLTGLLIACASSAPRPSVDELLMEKGLTKGEPVQRISNYHINGWEELDDRNLIFDVGVKDKYLVVLQQPCLNLESAFQIGFTSSLNNVDKFERIIVSAADGYQEHCDIAEIVALIPG